MVGSLVPFRETPSHTGPPASLPALFPVIASPEPSPGLLRDRLPRSLATPPLSIDLRVFAGWAARRLLSSALAPAALSTASRGTDVTCEVTKVNVTRGVGAVRSQVGPACCLPPCEAHAPFPGRPTELGPGGLSALFAQ